MIYNNDSIRQVERASIRSFMERSRGYLRGRVLDFGSGKQPYKDLVDGEYVPYERGDPFPDGVFDAVISNQVIQYLEYPLAWFMRLYEALKLGGHLVLTGPTNWPIVEQSDLQRFTQTGISFLLRDAGFTVLSVESRAELDLNGCKLSLGYGLTANKTTK